MPFNSDFFNIIISDLLTLTSSYLFINCLTQYLHAKKKKKNKAIAWQRVYFDMGNLTILKACTAPENFFKGEGVSESFFCPGGWGRGNFNKKIIIKLHSQIITLYFPSWSLHVKVNSHLDLKSCSLNRVSHFANICSCQYMALWE